MPAWYDILKISLNRRVDIEQQRASAAAQHHLIDREIERGVDSRRSAVAGLIAISTYFATADTIARYPSTCSTAPTTRWYPKSWAIRPPRHYE